MSAALHTDAAQIEAYPYAVGSTTPDGESVFVHFSDKGAADFFALLMGPGAERYVANVDTHEWHKVTVFTLGALDN